MLHSSMSSAIDPNTSVRKRFCTPNERSEVVDKGLDIQLHTKTSRHALKWGLINVVILSVLMMDISNRCPFTYSKWFYVEYAAAGFLAISVLYQFGRYFHFIFSFQPIRGTVEQKRLLQFNDTGTSSRTGGCLVK